jgi:hypothetical protein
LPVAVVVLCTLLLVVVTAFVVLSTGAAVVVVVTALVVVGTGAAVVVVVTALVVVGTGAAVVVVLIVVVVVFGATVVVVVVLVIALVVVVETTGAAFLRYPAELETGLPPFEILVAVLSGLSCDHKTQEKSLAPPLSCSWYILKKAQEVDALQAAAHEAISKVEYR